MSELEILLTNMQEATLEAIISKKQVNMIIDYITNLQQENKQLKEQLEYLRSNEYLNQVKWERNFNEELVKDLQQRIDKAIDFIKHSQSYGTMAQIMPHLKPYVNGDDLLKILGDKE